MTAPETDFYAGDPALHVLGGREEKPARIHRPADPKPGPTISSILADVRLRKAQLEGIPEEYAKLQEAVEALKGI